MDDFIQKTEKILERLRSDISTLRTGRATSALVEHIEVDYYGAKTPLKALAAISVPDARQIFIQPWDKQSVPSIEKAIQNSSLGLAPIADQNGIRISIPQLTEERRQELVRLLHKIGEEARIQVRRERDEASQEIERTFKAKESSEDERFREKSDLQKKVDDINKKIEGAISTKEKEIIAI